MDADNTSLEGLALSLVTARFTKPLLSSVIDYLVFLKPIDKEREHVCPYVGVVKVPVSMSQVIKKQFTISIE